MRTQAKTKREPEDPSRNVKYETCPDCLNNSLSGPRVVKRFIGPVSLLTKRQREEQKVSRTCITCGGTGEIPKALDANGKVVSEWILPAKG